MSLVPGINGFILSTSSYILKSFLIVRIQIINICLYGTKRLKKYFEGHGYTLCVIFLRMHTTCILITSETFKIYIHLWIIIHIIDKS